MGIPLSYDPLTNTVTFCRGATISIVSTETKSMGHFTVNESYAFMSVPRPTATRRTPPTTCEPMAPLRPTRSWEANDTGRYTLVIGYVPTATKRFAAMTPGAGGAAT